MFHLQRDDQPSTPVSSLKPFSSPAYRRGSVPLLDSCALPHASLFHTNHRAPLAPLDPQTTYATLAVAGDLMSTSSQFLGYAQSDTAQESERQRPADPSRYNIGRPIVPIRGSGDASEAGLLPPRRRSIPNHLQSSTGTARTSSHFGRPLSRRSSRTASSSVSSTRRPSLPTILLQPSATAEHLTAAHGSDPAVGYNARATTSLSGVDDLYSDLSSYTFGSAQPGRLDVLETMNPFPLESIHADRTPRPSVSGPSAGISNQLVRMSGRTPKMRTREFDEETKGDDEDEDETERQARTKMRAMNDGTRRPSLPVHSYSSGRSKSPANPLSAPMSVETPQASPSTPEDSGSAHEHSEAESESMASGGEEGEAGDFDTDVEFDFHHNSLTPALNDIEMADTASQHTFGRGGEAYVYNAISPFDDSMNIANNNESTHRSSPMIFAKTDADTDMALVEERRGSRPWSVAGPLIGSSGESRAREDSLATVTALQVSRSLTIDSSHALAPFASNPLQTKADSMTLESHAQTRSENQMDGGQTSQDASEASASAWEGFDFKYIFGERLDDREQRGSWQSNASSWMQVAPNVSVPGQAGTHDTRPAGFEAFDFQGWGAPVTGGAGRRPSTVTVGSGSGEDAFTRHVQRFDPVSSARMVEWSFSREQADGAGPDIPAGARWVQNSNTSRIVSPGKQEIWRHPHVGRFKVDTLLMMLDDPSKPPSQRVNVRHIPDPYSKANTRGGPMSVVHKHSRAIAFSIFRRYDLFGHRQTRTGGSSMPTSGSILLATKRVQEQYTSTRTTSQLNSHGLLSDGATRLRGQTTSGTSASDSGPSTHGSGRSLSKDPKDKGKTKKDKKGKGKEFASDTSSQTNSVGSVSSQTSSVSNTTSQTTATDEESLTFAKIHPSSSSGISIPVSPTIADTQFTYSSSVSDSTAVRFSTEGPSSMWGSPPPTASSDRGIMAIDEYDEDVAPRTSHAEAFATLDQHSIDYFRGRSEQRLSDHDPSQSRSIAERLRRRLLGQNPVKAVSRPPSGPPSAALEGHYTPPWMTMAPRSRVEERDRVIQNLNDSFKDVGLLPSFKPKGGRPRRRHDDDKVNIFSHVPPDSLHMLLPLWPGETDVASANAGGDHSIHNMPVEERQYLLVYYVPFEKGEDKGSKKQDNKKRLRSNSHAPTSHSTSVHSKTIILTSFSVCARLISYNDLLGTGVRLPVDGLSITGSMNEAFETLPSAAIRESRLETPWAIIGICNARQKGIEFLPDGLAKVGLAVGLPPTSPPGRHPVSIEAEEEEVNWKMTPIGRAAVEMAWLGCLAMTSFGPESFPSK